MKIIKYLTASVFSLMSCMLFTACDDWTDVKSIDLDYGTISSADPVAYEKYLANLRQYRSLPHTRVYAWINNDPEAFKSQGNRISALPDSVDVVVIDSPEAVTTQLLDEINQARTDKGQQFCYCINFEDIKTDYIKLCEDLTAKRLDFLKQNGEDSVIPAELENPDIADFIIENLTGKLAYFDLIGFDRLMAGFSGKRTLHLTDEELAEYNYQTNTFLWAIQDWHARHQTIKLDFLGRPQNIKSDLITEFEVVFHADGLTATNADMYSFILQMGENKNFHGINGMIASIPSLNANDKDTGYFPSGKTTVSPMAAWVAANRIGAMCIKNANNDYYFTNGAYSTLRNAIQTVNPAAK